MHVWKLLVLMLFLSGTNASYCQVSKYYNHWLVGDTIMINLETRELIRLRRFIENYNEQNDPNAIVSNAEGEYIFRTNITPSNIQEDHIIDSSLNISNHTLKRSYSFGLDDVTVVPWPNSLNAYLFLGIDDENLWSANVYLNRIIDDSGGVNIDTTYSNILLHEKHICRSLAAVKHCNNRDVWIIGHEYANDKYLAWLLTENGILEPPVISKIGEHFEGRDNSTRHRLRISLQGDKLVHTVSGTRRVLSNGRVFRNEKGSIQLSNFNRATGVISETLTYSDDKISYPQVAEFSTNSKWIYVSSVDTLRTGHIHALSVDEESVNAMKATRRSIAEIPNFSMDNPQVNFGGIFAIDLCRSHTGELFSLDLRPNNIPYGMDRIANENIPNRSFLEYNYISLPEGIATEEIFLAGMVGMVAPLEPTIFSSNNDHLVVCQGDDSIQLEITSGSHFDSLHWMVDNSIIAKDISSIQLEIDSVGSFPVCLLVYTQCGIDSICDTLEVINDVQINLGLDSIICVGDTLVLGSEDLPAGLEYEWSTGDSTRFINAMETGLYVVTVTHPCGTVTDSIRVTVVPNPTVDLGSDTVICLGSDWLLSPVISPIANANFIWSDNHPTLTRTITTAGVYVLSVFNECAVASDSISVEYAYSPEFQLPNDTTVCPAAGLAINLPDSFTNHTFEWSDGAELLNRTLLAEGFYQLTLTNKCGTAVDSINVALHDSVSFSLREEVIICADSSIELSVPYSNVLWNDDSRDSSRIINQPGTYKATVEGVCNTHTQSVNVIVNPLPELELSIGDTALCAGQKLEVTATGAATYTWMSNNEVVVSQNAATINVNVSDTLRILGISTAGCRATDSMVIIANPIPEALAFGLDDTLCVGDSVQLEAYGGTQYSWLPREQVSNDTIANPIGYPDNETSFTVTVSNDFGCINSDTVVLVQDDPDFIQIRDTSIAVCSGDTFSVQGLYTNQIISVDWLPMSNVVEIVDKRAFMSLSESGFVILRGSNQRGCKSRDSLVVIIHPLPTIQLTSDTVLCEEESLLLQATGGVVYRWRPHDNGEGAESSYLVTPDTSTNYVVRVTTDNGCVGFDSVLVDVLSLPEFLLPDSSIACQGDSLALGSTVNPTYTYAWQPSHLIDDSLVANPSIVIDQNFEASVLVTDSVGCTWNDTTFITALALPSYTIVDTVLCFGALLRLPLSIIEQSYTYELMAPDTVGTNNDTLFFEFTGSGIKELTIHHDNGCSITTTFNVAIGDSLFTNIPDVSGICSGDDVLVIAEPSHPGRWLPDGIAIIEGDSLLVSTPHSAVYYYSLQDSLGCSLLDSTVIKVGQYPITEPLRDTSICFDDTLTIGDCDASDTLFYEWQLRQFPLDSIYFVEGNCLTLTPEITQNGISDRYIRYTTNATGCTTKDTFNLGEFPEPVAFPYTIPSQFCIGDTVRLDAYILSQVASYELFIGDSSVGENIELPYIFTTDTAVTAMVKTSNDAGCAASYPYDVVLYPSSVSGLQSDSATCQGDTVYVRGRSDFFYNWEINPTAVVNQSDTAITFILSSAGLNTIDVSITDTNSCTRDTSLTYTVATQPDLAFISDSVRFCERDSLIVALPDSLSFAIQLGGGYVHSGAELIIYGSDEIIIKAENEQGCSAAKVISSTVVSPSLKAVLMPPFLCDSTEVLLKGVGGTSYNWLSPNQASNCTDCDSITFWLTTPTQVSVIIADDVCPSEQIDTLLTPLKPDTLVVLGDTSVLLNETLIYDLFGNGQYNWYTSQGDTCLNCNGYFVEVIDSINVISEQIDQNGCITLQAFTIYPIEDCGRYVLPNAITPNGDGLNDVLQVLERNARSGELIALRIYNRWGKLVFETNDPKEIWVPTDEQSGVFNYQMLERCDGNIQSSIGNVLILR